MTNQTAPTSRIDMSCEIPEHAWLVIELDDFFDFLDPMGLIEDRHRPHEYLPEIPDFVRMIVSNDITEDRINDVFVRFFEHSWEHGHEMLEALVAGTRKIRNDWGNLLDRSRSSWWGAGQLWKILRIEDPEGNGNFRGYLLNAVPSYMRDTEIDLSHCETIEDAIKEIRQHDGSYHDELMMFGEEG